MVGALVLCYEHKRESTIKKFFFFLKSDYLLDFLETLQRRQHLVPNTNVPNTGLVYLYTIYHIAKNMKKKNY